MDISKPFPRVQCFQEPGDRVSFTVDGRLAFTYHFGANYPRPFIYPLHSPAGHNVLAYGHSVDLVGHSHHRGIFIAHASVESQRFWSDKENRCVHQKLLKLENGPEQGSMASLNHWIADGHLLLEERRELTLDVRNVLSLRLEFTATEKDVALGKSNFGFLALRVAKTIGVAAGGGQITDAQGRINEQQVKDQSSAWCDYSGPVSATGWAGVTVHDDPANPHYPTHWMCRNDGWFSPAFNMVEPYTIPKGGSLVLNYRIIAHDGAKGLVRVLECGR